MTKEEMLQLREGDLVAMIRDGNDRTFFSKGFVYRVSRVVQDQVTPPSTPNHPSRDTVDRVYAQADFDVRSYNPNGGLSTSLSFLPEDVRRVDPRHERLQLAGEEVAAKLPNLNGAHYVNIVVRRNGKDEVYEADYLKELQR